jgi:hypothetical protein
MEREKTLRLDNRAHQMFHETFGGSFFISQSRECAINDMKGGAPVLMMIRFLC